jgi:cation:H+ antiporter
MSRASLVIVVGILMLCIGGDVTLTGALSISKEIGLSERVIGLTVMAIGTSLPEFVTSIQAVRKKETDMAIGNIVGSNLFNIFSVIGITSMIIPLPVSVNTLNFDYWWMLGFSLFICPFIITNKKMGRKSGFALVISLCTYITILFLN